MRSFKAVFKIIEESNCPLYRLEEHFVLTDKALSFPKDKESCLILVREMTQLLFELLDNAENSDSPQAQPRIFTCSGCTGPIKFIRVNPAETGDQDGAEGIYLNTEDQELLEKISGYPLLDGFPVNQLKKFIGCFHKQVIHAGSFLITKGDFNQHLYILLSGEVSVEDDMVKITTLREGDVCGEMSYFGNKIARSSIRAVVETKVLAISGDDFGKMMREAASVQIFMARLLAERLAKANTARTREFDACMHGRIKDMAPAELFQIFHMHQKTGSLSLELSKGNAKVSFREGCIINASYADQRNQNAIFSILAEKEGVYRFTVGLSPQEMKAAEIGDFMMLLMEGVKRVDEVNEAEGPLP
jgi:CRP/FNR family transcriptional regulator, cyclic AMP receptor protein